MRILLVAALFAAFGWCASAHAQDSQALVGHWEGSQTAAKGYVSHLSVDVRQEDGVLRAHMTMTSPTGGTVEYDQVVVPNGSGVTFSGERTDTCLWSGNMLSCTYGFDGRPWGGTSLSRSPLTVDLAQPGEVLLFALSP